MFHRSNCKLQSELPILVEISFFFNFFAGFSPISRYFHVATRPSVHLTSHQNPLQFTLTTTAQSNLVFDDTVEYTPTINTTVQSNLVVGSAVIYSPITNSLLYADVFGGTYYRYSFDDDKVYKIDLNHKKPITAFIWPVVDHPDLFYIGLDRHVYLISWDGISTDYTIRETIAEVDEGISFSCLVVAPNDDIFFGVTRNKFCNDKNADLPLYKYTPKTKEIVVVADGFIATYGLAVYEAKSILVQMDPCTGTLYEHGLNRTDSTFSKCIDGVGGN